MGDRYLRGRSSELLEEMPFMRSENQQYIHYRKGSVVMMSILDRLGEEKKKGIKNEKEKKIKKMMKINRKRHQEIAQGLPKKKDKRKNGRETKKKITKGTKGKSTKNK